MEFPDEIKPADYPQLRLLVWNRNPEHLVSGEDVLAIYERNWDMVEQDALSAHERALIDHLVQKHGNGVLHV